MQPAERKVNVDIPALTASIYDSGKMLSQLNRRFYRQGMEYAFDSVEVRAAQGEGYVSVYRLPHTWVTANSWVMAFSHWKNQQDEALEGSGEFSRRARYNDFKIYYNKWDAGKGGVPDQPANGYTRVEVPNNFPSYADVFAVDNTATIEWDYSELGFAETEDASSLSVASMYMIGDNYGTDGVGLIHNYALARARPQAPDPNTVDQENMTPWSDRSIYRRMEQADNLVSDLVLDRAADENEVPPYFLGVNSQFEWYPYGAMSTIAGHTGLEYGVKVDDLIVRSGTSAFTSDATGPFSAYCGLLCLVNNVDATVSVHVTHTLGSYGGVAARPMQEVN